ncbi:nitrous oxide reductase accessory protein NosL [Shewanella intestini]|uniref:Nitrous oxide reductase accessory protein NosL n=1 Tax=Shewanella intestini TaxID=2017544 RepID=A0ABS5I435_9GAMM|nr:MULTISPECIES: nitrous oxide reductase accessory protein NosL [Shewanella]MBR9728788.1 nitrous oxide reductase accessory protein NosL [Shewanella intestini]MRG36863.1 nitrous oxide reductase accessory protein NosL [Shewanella sp. XMDDZSB0408]
MKKLLGLLVLIPLLFACSQEINTATAASAQPIHDHDRCHMCGMIIKNHPGPKGQTHLKGTTQNQSFCSTRDMFIFALQSENKRQITDMFVHDMSKTGWDHPADSALIDAKTAWYVYGSNKKAAMGPAVASFGNEASAQAFAQEYGGKVLRFEQITTELLTGSK